jgi:hypothetical protein
MTRHALGFFLAMAMLPAGGCHRRAHAPQPAPVTQAAGDSSKNKQGEGNGTGAGLGENADEETDNPLQRFHEATVYVDGVPRIAFTYNEMPSSVKVTEFDWSGEHDLAHHMLIADYLRSLGVDINKVKETHWYGGRDRVVVITGDELRKNQKHLYFNFSRDFLGKPRVEWRNGVKTNDMVDIITDLAVYVDKKPPRWDRDLWSLIDDNGDPIDERIPYCKEEMPRRSVRVNVDGRFIAFMKRNLLEGNLHPLNGDAEGNVPAGQLPRYALSELLASKKVEAPKLRGVDLITRDERIVRLSSEESSKIEFSLQRHGGGVAEIFFSNQMVEAKALNIYVKDAPAVRPMRTLTLGHQARNRSMDSHPRPEKAQ